MAITSVDGIIGSAKQRKSYMKQSVTSKAAGTYQSLWTASGQPGAGSTPATGSGAVPTNSTAGSLGQSNPSNTLYLAAATCVGATQGTLIFYDRLVHTSGLSGTVATAQTVGTPALTRYTSGVDVELWLEFYTATGASAVNVTASYTNTVPTSGQTTTSIAFPVSPVAGQMIQLPLAAGDLGVTAVASVTLSATTGTAGSFGVTLLRRLAEIPITVVDVGMALDPVALGFPQIQSNACIVGMVLCSTTSTGLIQAAIGTADG
jgi:hypothetical protein